MQIQNYPGLLKEKLYLLPIRLIPSVLYFYLLRRIKKKKRPTGSNDPLGVRRAAIGILRTIIEAGLEIDIEKLIDFSIQQIKEEFNLEVELTLKSELVDFYNRQIICNV